MGIAKAVIPGAATGVLREWRSGLSLDENDVPYSEFLTVELAVAAVSARVSAIVTASSSFATHGANVLRVANSRGAESGTCWVAGVDTITAQRMFDNSVEIRPHCESAVSAQGDSSSMGCNPSASVIEGPKTINIMIESEEFRKAVVPRPDRTLARFSCTTRTADRCYWPHRTYPMLTYSIMAPGLEVNCASLGHHDVQVLLNSDQRIWFRGGPAYSELVRSARDPSVGSEHLDEQLRLYQSLWKRLVVSEQLALSDLATLITQYFSKFLLFHDTYEHVIRDMLTTVCVDNCADELMWCEADAWMLENRLTPPKRKDLAARQPVFPVPPFGPFVDVGVTTLRVHKVLSRRASSRHLDREYTEYYCKLFVAKEWKFIMNAMLFSRFSALLWKTMENSASAVSEATNLPVTRLAGGTR